MRTKFCVLLCTMSVAATFAQSKSSVQFYDSTGANKTAKIGWTGTNTGGRFFVQTPNDNTGMTVKDGNLSVNGSVTATGFSGDGTGLTNVTATPSAHAHPQGDVTGLSTSLAAKADTTYVNTKVNAISVPSLAGIRDTLRMKADTNHAHSAMITGVTGSGGLAATQSGQGVTVSGKLRPTGGNNGSTDSLARADHDHPAAGIADGSIDSAKVAADAVRGSHIKDGAVTGADLANGIIDSSKAAATSVGTYHLRSNAVTSAKIADGTVVSADLATGAVDSSRIAATGVGTYHLRDNAVTSAKIADASIVGADLANGAVDSSKIVTAGVGAYHLRDNAVTSAKIADGTVSDGDISSSAYISGTKINPQFGTRAVVTSGGVEIRNGTIDTFRINAETSGSRPTLFISKRIGTGWYAIGMFQRTTTSEAYVHMFGDLTANSCCASSDVRFKRNILPITCALARLQKLQGVTYEWDRAAFPERGFSEGRQLGLVAQEVEKVIPEVVTTDPEGYKALSYDKLTAVLIEAVKEQQGMITEQQTMISQLVQRVEQLEQRLSN